MTLKLDVGSGEYPHAKFGGGEGWTTVDLYRPADIKADMRSLPQADGEVDEIYCSHALEHVGTSDDAMKALREFRRVLKVGGRLTVLVPNLDYCAKQWLAKPRDPQTLPMLFGMRREAGEMHLTGWSERTLREDLHEAGFSVESARIIDSHGGETVIASCIRPEGMPAAEELQVSLYRNSAADSVLVACPTYKGKHYALEAYIKAYNAFAYPHRGLFMVDNTPTGQEYLRHLKSLGVPCDYIPPAREFQETFASCWKRIARHAADNGYRWVASIEQDNICAPIALDALLNVAAYCKAVHVAHSYPWHKVQAEQGRLIGLGCNLISTELLVEIFNREQWYTNAVESEIFEYPKLHGMPSVEVHNLFEVQHLDDEKGAEFFMFARETPPRFGVSAAEAFPLRYNQKAPH